MKRAGRTVLTVLAIAAVSLAGCAAGDDRRADQETPTEAADPPSSEVDSTNPDAPGSDEAPADGGDNQNGDDGNGDDGNGGDEQEQSGGVSSSATVSGGSDVRSTAEVRIGEILSDYDGVETSQGTQLSVPSEVLFDLDDDRLRADAQATVDDLAEVLAFYEDAPVEVVGHTDSQGPADYNQGLSERRAASVAAALEAAGIDPNRLTVSGRGEDEPVASNDTEPGRQANRRVELLVRGVRLPDADG